MSFSGTPAFGTLIDPTDTVIWRDDATPSAAAAALGGGGWLSLDYGFLGAEFVGGSTDTFGPGLPGDPDRGREHVIVAGVVQAGWTVTPTVLGANDLQLEIGRDAGFDAEARIIEFVLDAVSDGSPIAANVNGTVVSVTPTLGDNANTMRNTLLAAINALAISNLTAYVGASNYFAANHGSSIVLLGSGWVSLSYSGAVFATGKTSQARFWQPTLVFSYHPYNLPWYWDVAGAPPAALAITTLTLPDSSVGAGYGQAIAATGGSGTGYSWGLVSGQIPPGLILSPTGTPATVLAGIPVLPGVYAFRVRVTDSLGETTTHDYTIEIGIAILTTDQVLGLPAEDPDFPLSMWRFIIREIREKDLTQGNRFFERYFQGMNRIWQEQQRRTRAIPTLWDVLNVDAKYLRYMKAIVGWTDVGVYKQITDAVDDATLRRLISVSGQLWRERGPETTLLDILQVLVPTRVRLWNWFDFRWILGETGLSEDHEGADPWIIDLPEELLDVGPPPVYATDDRTSNLRIVDDGGLDRTLLKRIIRIMRPAGERYEITYLAFLDMFSIADDEIQWAPNPVGSSIRVADGLYYLDDDSDEQSAWTIVPGATTWSQYVVSAKLRGNSGGANARFTLVFYRVDADNYYEIAIDTVSQEMRLHLVVGGVLTLVDTFIFGSIGFTFHEDVYYTVRVSILREGGTTNRIVVFIDGEGFINTTSAPLTEGGVGFRHDADAILAVDDIEVLLFPSTTETVDINDAT